MEIQKQKFMIGEIVNVRVDEAGESPFYRAMVVGIWTQGRDSCRDSLSEGVSKCLSRHDVVLGVAIMTSGILWLGRANLINFFVDIS